ncbi:MAG: acetolactate synthase small subunit [Betaproteobacteria bacterium]|nr:acetolactate synthase small subunit [Betaproteobacteria bacterium]
MSDATATKTLVTLRLTVNNHPGVMSHVCGLFARRAYNLEGILVTPINGGSTCNVWLMINEDGRMNQVVSQVSKLHDILDVRVEETDENVFERLSACLEFAPVVAV